MLHRSQVHSALSLKYATKQFPTFNAWLFQLCMLYAFFNTAFSNSEGCNAADFVDARGHMDADPKGKLGCCQGLSAVHVAEAVR